MRGKAVGVRGKGSKNKVEVDPVKHFSLTKNKFLTSSKKRGGH